MANIKAVATNGLTRQSRGTDAASFGDVSQTDVREIAVMRPPSDFWFIRGFGGITGWSKTDISPILHPEGISAISRGLSEATPPPDEFGQSDLHPEGTPARLNRTGHQSLPASLQDANPFSMIPDRGCRGRSTPG